MTRLELCRKVHGLLRADTDALRSAPATTVGTTAGIQGEIIAFVDYAYSDIQKEQEEWAFMVKQGTFPLSNGTRSYSRTTIQGTITDFDRIVPMAGNWDIPHLLCYLTATGVSDSTPVFYVPYEEWRSRYDLGTRPSGKPAYFTVKPNQDVEFDPTPDASYTVALDYRRTPHTLSQDADEPIIPAKYQDAIVWKAVEYYCLTRDDSTEFWAKAKMKLVEEMGTLRSEQLPQMTVALDSFY